MNPDIVLVPTFSRPEMLRVCLEHIAACKDPDIFVMVSVDYHAGKAPPPLEEIEEVVALLRKQLEIRISIRRPHPYPGNSYNILNAYGDAWLYASEFVFLVEDDVMVEPDFFSWSRAVHEGVPRSSPSSIGRLFCSVGVANRRSGKVRSKSDYASLGVCFRRQTLAAIIDHACTGYFQDMRGYCRRKFGALFDQEDVEQDGLILRVMGSVNGVSAWPDRRNPKARHVGWYGYHRPQGSALNGINVPRPEGTLEERYRQVKERIAELEYVP